MAKYWSVVVFIFLARLCPAQDESSGLTMQLMMHLSASQKDFQSLHTDSITYEDENYKYFNSREGLLTRYISILQSKKNPSLWIYFIEYDMNDTDDLSALSKIEPALFKLINLFIKAGRFKGDEKTENNITRSNLYIAKTNDWYGEVVTNNDKKKFHILFTNKRWEE
ncbi:MAG: hypothetical protein JSS93_10755 [Bacteroidetes bacterium]|nr:hypothetical protein [Bacteroidota bacterium]